MPLKLLGMNRVKISSILIHHMNTFYEKISPVGLNYQYCIDNMTKLTLGSWVQRTGQRCECNPPSPQTSSTPGTPTMKNFINIQEKCKQHRTVMFAQQCHSPHIAHEKQNLAIRFVRI